MGQVDHSCTLYFRTSLSSCDLAVRDSAFAPAGTVGDRAELPGEQRGDPLVEHGVGGQRTDGVVADSSPVHIGETSPRFAYHRNKGSQVPQTQLGLRGDVGGTLGD